MATAALAIRQHSVPIEDSNFLRLFLLIKKVGTKVCYNVFHRYYSKNKKQLYQQLLPYKNLLKRFLFPAQYDLIYGDPNQETDSTKFDITLFLLLFRKTCPALQAPRKGWNRRPSQGEVSEGANFERLRIQRNLLAHDGSESLVTAVFNMRWQDAKTVLLALGADVQEIDEYLNIPLDNTNFNVEEEISILNDILFQHIDVSFMKSSENEQKISALEQEITKLQGKLHHSSEHKKQVTLEDIERRMKTKYSRTERIISCLEWDTKLKGSFKLEDIFIEPRIWQWKQRTGDHEELEMSIYDAICTNSQTDAINACFISDPGKGKSVLLKKLALDYAQCDVRFQENLPGISLVILIRCKELIGYPTLTDYIEEQLLKDASVDGERVFDILQQNGEKCLFLIDGLDEVLHVQSSSVISELYSLLERRSFNNASIVATSRPFGLNTMDSQLTLFRKTFVIAPLNDDDIKAYICRFFSEKDKEYCMELFDNIVNNNQIRELVSSPLTLSIVCNIYFHAGPVPKNIPQLYHELVCQMIQQFKKYYGFGESRHGARRVSEFLLKGIGHVAFQSLKSGNEYFEENELVNYFAERQKKKGIFSRAKKWIKGLNPTSVLQLGFLTADSGPNPRKVGWRYQFEPKMCRKYIAAEYIVTKLLKHGIKELHKMLLVEHGASLSSSTILKTDHELCLFIVDSLGRRGEIQLCRELYEKLFKEFGSLT